MTIIVSKDGKNAKKIPRSSFEQEKELQKYLEDNPDIVPIYEIDEDLELLVLAREFRTNSGPIDALGTDKNGIIYIIETKLVKNPDRRHIVAQVLDYGTSLWHARDSDDFFSRLEEEAFEKHQKSFKERLRSTFNLNDEEIPNIIDNLKKNLADGQFRFVVLLDKIEPELKELVYFINKNSNFSIYPVEFEYYNFDDDYQIIIPKLYGAEIKKSTDPNSSSTRRKWDENSFFEDAGKKLDPKQIQLVRKLYAFSKEFADHGDFGTGSKNGSFSPKFFNISGKSPYSIFSDGRLALNFHWLNDTEEAERISDEFRDRVSKIKGFVITPNYEKTSVIIPIETWSLVVDDFISAVKDLMIT
jgi:hypothetical protein